MLDKIPTPPNKFDAVIEILLTALLAFMPLVFGVVHGWSEEIVIIFSGAIVLCFLLKLVCHRDCKLIWSWAYIPLGVFVFIGVFQLVKLPTAFVGFISPNTVLTKTQLLNDLPNAENFLKSMTISFYPNATKHDLRLVFSIAAVFVVVLNVFRRPSQIKRLLMTIAIIGGFIALLAMAQNLFGNGKLYWFIFSKNTQGYSGPFVNHSNYGQFMNLSIGAALGWLCFKLSEVFSGRRITPPAVLEYLGSRPARTLWLMVVIMSIGAATVFISLTRGGMLSMLIAMAFTTLLFTWRRSLNGNGWIIVVMVLIAFSCVLYIGFDAVYDRLATLRDFRDSGSSRLQILKDIAVIFSRFPIFGTGLGTHSVVYPMFDHSTITTLVAHAENEYAQAAEEVGLIGLGSLIVFGIIICINYARNIRRSRTQNSLPVYSAVYGLGFGILAILINSLSDFGQHLPANSFLTAIFCALLLSIVGQNKNVAAAKANANIWIRKIFLIAAAVIWIWMVIGADNYRLAEKTWKQAQVIENIIIDNNWQGSQTEYEDLISYAEKAAALQPDNIKYQYWLNVYRWRLLNQTAQIDDGELVVSPELLPAVRDIIDKFNKARMICPTYGPTYSTVGQIQKFVLGDDSGAEQIKKGYLLAPCDAIACFVAGWLDVVEARGDECVEKFDRAIALDPRFFRDVANIYINDLSRPHLAILAAGENIGRLRYVANMLEEMQYSDLAEQVLGKMEILLEEQCTKPDVTANDVASLAGIYSRHGKTAEAIECYNRALAMDYSRVYWRLDLARQLAKTKQIKQAIRELRICLRLRPQMKAAENLLVELSVDPNGFNSEETNLP